MVNGTFQYDFALIQLSTYVHYDDYVRAICLPNIDIDVDLCQTRADIDEFWVDRDNCKEFVTAGWGSVETRIPLTFEEMRAGQVFLDKTMNCRQNRSESANFCAANVDRNLCMSSPGMPLMCVKEDRFYLVGVFSMNPSNECGPLVGSELDIYGRTCEILYWIRVTIGDMLPTTTTPARIIITQEHRLRTFLTPEIPTTPGPAPPIQLLCQKKFMMALGEAAAGGDLERVTNFLERDADPDGVGYPASFYPDPCPWDWHWPNATALAWAAGCNQSAEVLSKLIEFGASLDARDGYGMSPIVSSGYHGNVENLRLLINSGANVNIRNNGGDSALSEAAFFGYNAAVKLLLENGANVNTKSTLGATPLMEASENNHFETVRLLIEGGAYLSERTLDGFTALHYAAENGNDEIVEILLRHGAYVDAKEQINNFTPLQYAARNNHESTIRLLLSYDAKRNGCNHPLCKVCQACEGFGRP